MKQYIIRYLLGGVLKKLHVEAHNEKQARDIGYIQARYGEGSRPKVDILYVWEEGEPDPYLKELDKYRYK